MLQRPKHGFANPEVVGDAEQMRGSTGEIEVFLCENVEPHLSELALLRIEVFREWPYLYEGDFAYEENYLRTYADSPDSVVVLAREGGRIVGAATALPLCAEGEEMVSAFAAQGYDPEGVFYFGESVLMRPWRGRGIGRRFMEERLAAAGCRGAQWSAFCAVRRDADDPRRPQGFRPLDGFWRSCGFRPVPGLTTVFSWREIGEAAESAKTMDFWIRKMDG